MVPRSRSSQSSEKRAVALGRRAAVGGVALLAVGAMSWWFGAGILAAFGRRMAAARMEAGALSVAREWLSWSYRFDPDNGPTALMQATCLRRLGRADDWRKALESARRNGAPAECVQDELQLGLVRKGEWDQGAELQIGALIEAGTSPHDVAESFMLGYLARGENAKAKLLLDSFTADFPQNAHVRYLWGLYWQAIGEGHRAITEFQTALAKQPGHELSRRALAEELEAQDQVERAASEYAEMAARSPGSEAARVGLAGVLRKQARVEEARALLEPLASLPAPSPKVVLEMAQIELELGNYREATAWFGRLDLDPAKYPDGLAAAATASALAGEILRAETLFAEAAAAASRSTRIHDLQVRLLIDRRDLEAADELRRLSVAPPESLPGSLPWASSNGGSTGSGPTPASESELYASHCRACHGSTGDGDGRAARHLFPKPRDLRMGRSRLVSTRNAVPTLADVEAVIGLGMPGTAMPPFDDLTHDERTRLAEEVLRMRREGIRDQFIGMLKQAGEEVNEDEIEEVILECSTPGEVVGVPVHGAADKVALQRGRDAYVELGCHHCHGMDGVGAWDNPLLDEEGRPTRARDLTREPFKGGESAESIYVRIRVGMPGSAHPASSTIPRERLVDLVHYCRSLRQKPARVLTNHERGLLASGNAYLAAVGKSPEP